MAFDRVTKGLLRSSFIMGSAWSMKHDCKELSILNKRCETLEYWSRDWKEIYSDFPFVMTITICFCTKSFKATG